MWVLYGTGAYASTSVFMYTFPTREEKDSRDSSGCTRAVALVHSFDNYSCGKSRVFLIELNSFAVISRSNTLYDYPDAIPECNSSNNQSNAG